MGMVNSPLFTTLNQMRAVSVSFGVED